MSPLAVAMLATAAATLAVARRMLLVVVVHGNSMAPTFHDGDRLLVRRRTPSRCTPSHWRAGDVVVFPAPGRDPRVPPTDDDPAYLVKRVVAVPGDPVPQDVRPVVGGADTVPEGCLVVRGDASRSADSRHFGFVPFGTTVGVVARSLAVAHRTG